MPAFIIGHFIQIHIVNHDLIHTDLLVNPADHHLLIDGLILSSDKITVKIHIHIIHRPHMRQWLIYINVIHIKSMFRQFKSTFPEKFCTIDHGMHQYVMSFIKMPHITPGKDLIFRKTGLTHDPLVFCPFLLIYIICQKHIKCHTSPCNLPKLCKNRLISVPVYPVITVHYLKI